MTMGRGKLVEKAIRIYAKRPNFLLGLLGSTIYGIFCVFGLLLKSWKVDSTVS